MSDDNPLRWNQYAGWHMIGKKIANGLRAICTCPACYTVCPVKARYCPGCGFYMADKILSDINLFNEHMENWDLPLLTEEQKAAREGYVFPSCGIYIYYHPYEGYKIGKAENITRRMAKHECSAPSLELLHVIETSDLDWCERFLHDRFRHRRIFQNHEYFDFTDDDLDWLFSIKVLEPPRDVNSQLSLLDLL